jgi:hypothetical protein
VGVEREGGRDLNIYIYIFIYIYMYVCMYVSIASCPSPSWPPRCLIVLLCMNE